MNAARVGQIVALPAPRREWFADARGRSLRMTWHEDAQILVVSIWQQDQVIATFHLDAKDGARLTALGADVVRAWAASQDQPGRKMDRSVSRR